MKLAAAGSALLTLVANTAWCQYEPGRRAAPPDQPGWEFALTAYPTQVRDAGGTTTSVIGAADRGALHLEARYGYEAKDARSVFAGWTFSGGETIKWEVTPLVGAGWGPVRAFIPGVEASLTWGRFDFYIEGELVRDCRNSGDNYNYAWSELGFRATEWLRVGAVGQRTRLYGGERDFQRGPFVQATFGRATLGGYWFNPGGRDEVVVASIGVSF